MVIASRRFSFIIANTHLLLSWRIHMLHMRYLLSMWLHSKLLLYQRSILFRYVEFYIVIWITVLLQNVDSSISGQRTSWNSFPFKLHTWFFVVAMSKLSYWYMNSLLDYVSTKFNWLNLLVIYIFDSKFHMMDWGHHIRNNPNKHFICFEP